MSVSSKDMVSSGMAFDDVCPDCGHELDFCTCVQEVTPYSIDRRD